MTLTRLLMKLGAPFDSRRARLHRRHDENVAAVGAFHLLARGVGSGLEPFAAGAAKFDQGRGHLRLRLFLADNFLDLLGSAALAPPQPNQPHKSDKSDRQHENRSDE